MGQTSAATRAARPGAFLRLVERKSDRRTEVADLTDELTARRAEAFELVDGLAPLLSFLIAGGRELSPRHYQAAIAVRERLARYRRQWEPNA